MIIPTTEINIEVDLNKLSLDFLIIPSNLILINLIDNALYWIKKKAEKGKHDFEKTYIELRNSDNTVQYDHGETEIKYNLNSGDNQLANSNAISG